VTRGPVTAEEHFQYVTRFTESPASPESRGETIVRSGAAKSSPAAAVADRASGTRRVYDAPVAPPCVRSVYLPSKVRGQSLWTRAKGEGRDSGDRRGAAHTDVTVAQLTPRRCVADVTSAWVDRPPTDAINQD
jgi:hypothetical protein